MIVVHLLDNLNVTAQRAACHVPDSILILWFHVDLVLSMSTVVDPLLPLPLGTEDRESFCFDYLLKKDRKQFRLPTIRKQRKGTAYCRFLALLTVAEYCALLHFGVSFPCSFWGSSCFFLKCCTICRQVLTEFSAFLVN